ncbi:porphobilinogen synthase [Sporanaerobium hydrogeniformans]|uniref:Porphobilinogen synthase n=1 Tax=Sporanaerobium hydrogeniformans TaxID=3072179 RepID=A0AC61DGH4_9FIRM|nr:porphobilinogen synthase [Sporanaerobium hydrogeniformans]PHV71846.1 porphobilinogen synthase [Sporanaerobium hydrogeniformans]
MDKRPRRLRYNPQIRTLVRETSLEVSDLIYPLFIKEGKGQKEEIHSLKGIYRWTLESLEEEINEIVALGIEYVLLFGIPYHKDNKGSEAYNKEGIVQQAIRKIKSLAPHLYVITDVCMCEYTSHGHCGILDEKGYVHNEKSLYYLGQIAVSHAEAGADMIAPSDMMDGRVGYMRHELDEHGFNHIPIMSYSAKYASSFYGPFREAAGSVPAFGDRKTYQMDMANTNEALREVALDIEEGADIVMVKPALSYLDIIRRIKDTYNMPLAAYQVSGEYAMLKMAVANGLLNEEAIYEATLSIKRAGADMIITYFAKDLARKLKG